MDTWKQNRRFITIAGVLTLFALSACTSVLPVGAPSNISANASLTLTVWHTQTGAAARLLTTLANDFHKAYSNITVRVEQRSNEGDLLRQGLAAIAMNQPPDLVIASPRTIADFARKGALVNLEPLANDAKQGLREEDRQDFFPGILDAGRFPEQQNQLFAFPFDTRAVVLYYNADLLTAAKVEVPPRTWDQFGSAARAATKGNVRGWVMSPSAAVFYTFLFSRGGSVLNDPQTQAQFNDDVGLKSLQLIAALTKSGAAYLAENVDGALYDFAEGETALWFGTTDDLTAMADAITRANGSFRWDVANVPQNDPGRPLTTLFGSSIAIFTPVLSGVNGTTNERARAAWLFARWLAAPEQSARWARATFTIPVRTSVLQAGDLPAQLQRLRDGFGDTLATGRPLPTVKDAGQIDAATVEMWTSVANGADPAAALKNAATRVNRILGQVP